jgi:YidC/Oxa1 family membrane protein insertase
MRDKNLLLFILLASLIMGVWFYLREVTTPEQQAKKDNDVQVAKVKDEKKDDAKTPDEPPKKKEEAKKKDEPPRPPRPPEVAAPTEETLGGEGDYYITVVLTSRGAGVRRLSLKHFEAADWLGRPDDGKELQLIQDDPFQPSFRMYHFPDGNAEVPPLLGLGERQWKREQVEKNEDAQAVTFSTHVPGVADVRILKTYRLEPRTYHVTMTLRIEDRREAGGPARTFRYQLTGGQGLPVEGEWYTGIFRNAVVGLVDNGAVYSRELETADRISLRGGGDPVPLSKNRATSVIQYAGVLNQYFGSVIVADNEQPPAKEGGGDFKNLIAWARATNESGEIKGAIIDIHGDDLEFHEVGAKAPVTYRLLERVKDHLNNKRIDLHRGDKAVLSFYETPEGMRVATWIRAGQTPRASFDDITVRVNSEPIKLAPGQTVAHRYLLYHGPAKTRLLGYLSESQGAVTADLATRYTDTLQLYSLTDWHTPGVMGSFSHQIGLTWVIIQFTRAMHWILWVLSLVLPGSLIGLSIIFLTVIVRGLMFPISRRQAMFSIKMQALAPELKKLSEKYKNDAQAKGQAVMELYRKHGIHPLGSCLPLLLQMPIFMGLYFALQESLQYRLAPFLYVENLAAPDMLLWWTQQIPFISDPDSMGGVFYLGPYLNILPIFAVVLMVIQQQLMTPPPTDEQQEAQQKMMKFMSIFFGVLFYKVAAGLCIYFISTNLWGLAERKLLPRKKDAPAPGAETTAVASGAPPPRKGPRGGRKDPKKPAEPPGIVQRAKDWWAEVLKQAEKK